MSLVRAQLGEPQQSSLLTALFSFLSKFTAKSGEKVSVKKTVLWTVFSELELSECCLRTNRSKRGSCLPSLQSKLGEPQQSSLLTALFSFLSKFTAKSGEKVSVKKTVLWTVFSELGLSEGCLRTNRSKRGSYLPFLQSKLGEPEKRRLYVNSWGSIKTE